MSSRLPVRKVGSKNSTTTSARTAAARRWCRSTSPTVDGIARLGAALNERHGKLDILVGNAGIAGPSSPLGHIELKPWTDVMAINVTANFQLIRCMEPLLQQSDAGRAVFVTSSAASSANAYRGPYAASKAALDTLVRSWANETASTPIRVNLFDPGPIRTRMRATVFPGEDPMTLDTPEQVADFIVPMCLPSWSETGKLYDYRQPHGDELPFAVGLIFRFRWESEVELHDFDLTRFFPRTGFQFARKPYRRADDWRPSVAFRSVGVLNRLGRPPNK